MDERWSFDEWAGQVRQLARARHAVILAHNYQLPWIQDVADHVGDSLALSRVAAASDAEVIVFCGVYFMAETAKILAPDRTVLLPEPDAGCSLADTVTADQVIAWRTEHPGAVVVAYVNTSAAVKAEADVCCTSANAVDVVRSIPAGVEILFLPDFFLGQYVMRVTGRPLELWMGECHVHAGISPDQVRSRLAAHPQAELFIHPECGCTTSALYLLAAGDLPADRTRILSTGAMVHQAREVGSATVLVATETGILHQLRAANPRARFEPVHPGAECRYMKMITPEKLLRTVRDGVHEVHVPEGTRVRAARAVSRMVALGSPSAVGGGR
ncbi:MAG: quinolinate synthase NadA [Actinomycetes bacterium]